jgi:tetratricopeptide (TPR) repeat protein
MIDNPASGYVCFIMRTHDARWTAALAVALIIAACPALSIADRITTNDGRVLTGAIVSENANEISLRTDVGTLRIRKADVRNLVREDTTAEEVNADAAFTGGKLAEAQRLYQEALTRIPPNSQAVQRLQGKLSQLAAHQQQSDQAALGQMLQEARGLINAGQYDAAIKKLGDIMPMLTSDEQTSAVRRLIAETHFTKAQKAADSVNLIQVERELRDAITAFEPYYKAHLAYGELLLRNSVTEQQGIESVLRGLRYGESEMAEEERMRYHFLVGKRFFQRGDFDEAAEHFIASMGGQGRTSANKEALELAVQSYIKMGEQNIQTDFQKTIGNLSGALRLNPRNADAHFLLGRIYRDTGETSKAVESLEQAVEINPTYKNAHHYLALAYIDAFDYDSALEHLELELKNDPNNYDALVDRAEAQIRLAAYDKADADLESAINIESSKWRAYLVRGILAFVQEQYEPAQENLMKVLSIKPDAVEAHIQMGKVLQAQKKSDEAKQWFTNVVEYLQKAPSLSFRYRTYMAEAQTALGEIDLAEESPRQAETRFRDALRQLSDFPPALNKIGDVKRRLGSELADPAARDQLFKEAEEYYRQAIDENPRNPEFYLSLGILYHKNLKDTQRAITNYRRYLDLGGRDTVNVNKWIEEAGGGIISDDESTPTVTAAATLTDPLSVTAVESTGTLSGQEGIMAATDALPTPAPEPGTTDALPTPALEVPPTTAP